jgi:hypothetical protein
VDFFCVEANRGSVCTDKFPCRKATDRNDRVAAQEDGCTCLDKTKDPDSKDSKEASTGQFCCADGSVRNRFTNDCLASEDPEEDEEPEDVEVNIEGAILKAAGAEIAVSNETFSGAKTIQITLNYTFDVGVTSKEEAFSILSKSGSLDRVGVEPAKVVLAAGEKDVDLDIKSNQAFKEGDTFTLLVKGTRENASAAIPPEDQTIIVVVESN